MQELVIDIDVARRLIADWQNIAAGVARHCFYRHRGVCLLDCPGRAVCDCGGLTLVDAAGARLPDSEPWPPRSADVTW